MCKKSMCKNTCNGKTENSLNKITKIECSKICGISVEPCLGEICHPF